MFDRSRCIQSFYDLLEEEGEFRELVLYTKEGKVIVATVVIKEESFEMDSNVIHLSSRLKKGPA